MYLPREMRTCWLEAGQQFPVLLLTGPRQVGKTTLLQHLCEDERTYVTLDARICGRWPERTRGCSCSGLNLHF